MTLPTSRRAFLSSSGTALGGAWLLGLGPVLDAASAHAGRALAQGLPLATFTPREGADFEAFSARIIPTDDTPGAREAGAVHFADFVLGDALADLLPIVRQGLADMNDRVRAAVPGRDAFAELTEAQQDEIIGAVEHDEPAFFFFARTLVVMAMVTHPDHGGNRDGVGWRLMGFSDTAVHQPPFGWYDRAEHGAREDA